MLVLLSLFLSFTLWTTGRDVNEGESMGGTSSPARVSLFSHSAEDVFRPTIIALHGTSEEEPLLVGNTYELRAFFESHTEKKQLSQLESREFVTLEEYLEKIQSERAIELIYPEELPFGLIADNFEEMSSDIANVFFDRIIINLNQRNVISFYHTKSKAFYTTSLLEDKPTDLNIFLNKDNLSYLSATPMILKDKIKYLPTGSFEMSYKSYILDQLSKTSYINNFFPDTSLVDVRSSENYTRYIDLTKEVTIDDTNHVLNYLRQIQGSNELNAVERYNRSFKQIDRFENWSDTFVLSNYNREDEILSFRREIQGIGVFSPNEYESVSEISLVENGVTHLKIPLRFANTPINIKGSPKKTLISGVEMVEELRTVFTEEEFQKIDDFSLGYSWQESKEESQVINFNPSWYILYENKWVMLSSLLESSKEAANGF